MQSVNERRDCRTIARIDMADIYNSKTGEVSEWSKEHAWKVCILQKGIEGSNPSLSAIFANT
ncbi:MAG: hypothetical protein JWR02_2452 [Mucilaginibacter sp.]|nr:hypothetical protein [Mucilaginibacter sp.]